MPLQITHREAHHASDAVDGLTLLLVDAARRGTGVAFLTPFMEEEAEEYWLSVIADVWSGNCVLLTAELEGRVVGTVQLRLEPQPDGTDRAELKQLLAHSSEDRQGILRALLVHAEEQARSRGCTTLLLFAPGGDGMTGLYASYGLTIAGQRVEDTFDGTPMETTAYLKRLTDVPNAEA